MRVKILFFIFIFVGLEVLLSIKENHLLYRNPQYFMIYKPHPYFTFTLGGRDLYRGEKILPKMPNEKRIIIVGASAAYGSGVSASDKAWSSVLERKLNMSSPPPVFTEGKLQRGSIVSSEMDPPVKPGDDIEYNPGNDIEYNVINASVPGYMSSQELMLLQLEILDLKPDMVIVYTGFNDVARSWPAGEEYRYDAHRYWYIREEQMASLSKSFAADVTREIVRYLNYSRVFHQTVKYIKKVRKWLIKKNIIHVKPKVEKELFPPYPDVRNIPERIENFIRHIELMSSVLKERNIKSLFVLQPVLTKDPSQKYAQFKKDMDSLNEIHFPEVYEGIRTYLLNKKWPQNQTFWDAAHFFDAVNETVFIDCVHNNDQGQEMIAKAIKGHIDEFIR